MNFDMGLHIKMAALRGVLKMDLCEMLSPLFSPPATSY